MQKHNVIRPRALEVFLEKWSVAGFTEVAEDICGHRGLESVLRNGYQGILPVLLE